MCEGGRRWSRTAGATNRNDVTGMGVWWWECGRLAMAKQSYCRLLQLGEERKGCAAGWHASNAPKRKKQERGRGMGQV